MIGKVYLWQDESVPALEELARCMVKGRGKGKPTLKPDEYGPYANWP